MIISVASPVVTNVLSNKHQVKILNINKQNDKGETIKLFLSELVYLGSAPNNDFAGISKEALRVTQYLDENSIKVLLRLNSEISKINLQSFLTGETVAERNFYVFENPKEPKTYRASKYYEIISYFIEALRD